MSNHRGSLKVSGSGKVTGGIYDDIKVSGSGHIDGDCDAIDVKVSGSAHFNGSLKVKEKLHCSGSCHINGAVEAGEVHASGSLNTDSTIACGVLHVSGGMKSGTVHARECHFSGGSHIDGALVAKQLKCSGSMRVDEGVESENAYISGMADVKGLFNANNLEIQLSGRSFIEEIGCDTLNVYLHIDGGLRAFFGIRPSHLRAGTIEGNDISLTNTEASVVRGARVVIHEGCSIGRVEYSGSLTIDPSSTVGEQVKV